VRKAPDTREGITAGIDEAGRGPLAGPVFAGAVILHPARPINGLDDSKKLSPARREVLAIEIEHKALAWSIAWADVAEIDSLNILHATMLAMRRAVIGLRLRPSFVEIDGNRLPNLDIGGRRIHGRAIVGGDATVAAISAASIMAKVRRDACMRSADHLYPGYGFAQHKGYGTALHRDSLSRLGPCPIHRRSFKPVSLMISDLHEAPQTDYNREALRTAAPQA
jgi:ribonuclease HII